ncbi:Glycosyltransferase involved in cell wall bisynthesis (RfaB) [Fructobacillus evanidus]|uniref:Glycosyltransferase involved in cell wall bisynthesis (RfaB) n=2 Tax=Fructobacillus evanidus TaxID=3064281 RepID=A0ABN9YK91_9LACO|nr:Glycosyltransferase involved in cell wall bisynthesis (RfaB) [Fructobacillus sp. LMG 32999]CAK1223672.1 Glycosyltransferase involved in cell wall bisynthesis (RfaB) [Fructobacillus sp. LMG 32999]CAK1223743.1 Glycosyltransferase involved in cell wall bisynthesis (RfaB) [Fructobacillus sp. LMG 32999]CAK1230936.1 Glycosyltransferase involved in cell wall bisynthesis (RfaB) [Fructobacillus sp. LMG 32999]CAK1250761.1 Glycosyltransferase involved in cell wall bisynthesis (RfaB) [Fructobacillus sp.
MTVVMNIYRHIDREAIQFDFAGTEDDQQDQENEYIDEIKALGGRVYVLHDGGIIAARKLINQIFNRYSYEIVHYHQLSEFGMTFDLLKKYGVKKLIVHSHATVMSETKWKIPRNRLFSLPIYFYSNRNIAVSNEAGRKLFLSNHFEFIPNAIDQTKFAFNFKKRHDVRIRLGLNNHDFLIGHVGRFAKQKNQLFLIPVMARVIKQNQHFYFLFIGDGPEKDFFKQVVQKAGLSSHVIILDSTPSIKDYYSAMDLFVLPSLFEGLPMVGIEAQANGLPIVVADTISQQLKITKTAFLPIQLKEKNIEQWVKAILTPSSRVSDDQVRSCFLQAGFLIESSIARWEKMYLA